MHVRPTATFRISWLATLASAALVITVIWTWAAQTQASADLYSNIVANAEGRSPTPFVTRRLAADGGRLIAKIVPDAGWKEIVSRVYAVKPLAKILNNPLNWTPADFPLLASTTFLIWLSVIGFMLVIRALIRHFYVCQEPLSILLALVSGFGLLTACGDHHYGSYPYDYPNAFVFALTLLGIVRNNWWTPLAFAMAAYSKETSFLLIILFAILLWPKRGSRYWITLAILLIFYVAIRFSIQTLFVSPTTEHLGFWSAKRNTVLIGHWAVYDFWLLLICGVVLHRIATVFWRSIPASLRLAAPVFLLLLGAAFFKGWLEERRQYLEAYPVCCLIIFQWAFAELGLASHFKPRTDLTAPAHETVGSPDA